KELAAPRYEVALALEHAALTELHARRPDRVLETNVEFWAAIVLDFAQIPAEITPSMFLCARTAGWSAHILEQKLTGRLVRASAAGWLSFSISRTGTWWLSATEAPTPSGTSPRSDWSGSDRSTCRSGSSRRGSPRSQPARRG